MKKAVRNLICVLLTAAVLTGCAGCSRAVKFASDFIEGAKSAVAANASPAPSNPQPTEEPTPDSCRMIQFYNDDGDTESVSKNKIGNYKPKYFKYMSDYYKRQLSQEEQIAYNAFLYAMEHDFTNIVMEPSVFALDFDIFRAREALALDSPFLEQNIGTDESYTASTACYTVNTFHEAARNLKMQALAKAEEIVASIPADVDTDIKRMAYLYDYVRSHVKYSLYEENVQPDYLYDALCKGVTVCDGYSNALSLLFNIAGIECCEVMGSGSTEEGADGHTWVAASLDGTFYNFDATNDAVRDDGYGDYRCYFGVSDKVMDISVFEYDDMRPVCSDESRDMIMADGSFGDMLSYASQSKAAGLCNERAAVGKMRTLLAFKGNYTQDNVESFVNGYIELLEYGESIQYVTLYNRERTLFLVTIEE